jgi:hypothetical protein
MFRRLTPSSAWVNRDAVDAITEDADGTYTVTMRGGTVYPGISRQRLELAFPEFIAPPPPHDPLPLTTPPGRPPITRPPPEEG